MFVTFTAQGNEPVVVIIDSDAAWFEVCRVLEQLIITGRGATIEPNGDQTGLCTISHRELAAWVDVATPSGKWHVVPMQR